jgi:hypothetical protein
MLTSEMTEAQTGVITIEDFEYDAVLEMVRYLVCGKCHFTEVNFSIYFLCFPTFLLRRTCCKSWVSV